MSFKNEYLVFFKEITSIKKIKELTDEQIDLLFDRFLHLLPNNGKLYKYRSFSSKYFLKSVSNLRNGEIWFPRVSQLNDKIDTTLIYKTERTTQEIEQYYLQNKYKIFYFNLYRESEHYKKFNEKDLVIFRCLASTGDSIKTISDVSNLLKISVSESKKLVFEYKKLVKEAIQKAMTNSVDAYINLDVNLRNDYRVFSMSQTYNQDSMWAYYADSNNGYCIEYDFKKAKWYPRSIKELLLSTFKVEYSDVKTPIDILEVYDITYKINTNKDDFDKYNRMMMKSLLTKRKSWKQEKEWRIIGEKEVLKADLVTGIIIDEIAFQLNENKANKLIKLADKKWNVRVRVLDRDSCSFKYVKLKTWNGSKR